MLTFLPSVDAMFPFISLYNKETEDDRAVYLLSCVFFFFSSLTVHPRLKGHCVVLVI